MRKLLFSFIAFLMLLFTPAAFAQHGGHAGGGSRRVAGGAEWQWLGVRPRREARVGRRISRIDIE